MAPFDLNYTSDELLRGATLPERLVFHPRETAARTETKAFLPPAQITPAPTDAAPTRAYLLIDGASPLHTRTQAIGHTVAPGMSTQSYIEYLLQTLDKNSLLTSIVFIACYAGLLHVL
jgi:hypothetical protein